MATRKRTVEIDIVVDDKDAKRGLKSVSGEVTTTANRFSDAAKIIGAAVAAKALGAIKDFVGGSIQEFKNLNESLNAVEVVFGDASEGIQALGEGAAESLGLSNAEFNTTAVQMSAFAKQIAGDGGDVVGVVEELTRRIADFASVMNIEVADAARIFQSGLAGETEPLRKFGIDLSAATVNAEGLAMGLGGANGQLDAGEKVLARYATLMGQTEQVAGDFANTSDDLANKTRILEARMADSRAELGEALVPAMQSVLEVGGDFVPWLTRLAGGFAEATGAITMTELVLRRIETEMGVSRSSAEAFGTALKELSDDTKVFGVESLASRKNTEGFREELDELLTSTNLSREELEKLVDGLPFLTQHLGLTEGKAAILEQTLRSRLSSALTDAEKRAREMSGALGEAAGAVANLAEEQLAAADPAFALLKANEQFVTAQRKYNEAVAEFGAGSAQARSAQAELLETTGKLNATQQQFATEFGPEGEEALRQLAQSAGVYGDDLARVLRFIRAIARDTKMIPPVPGSGGGGGSTGPFHEGGTVPGTPGSDQLIMAQAGETVTRRSEVNGSGGGFGPIILQLDGKVVAEVTREHLIRMQRRNGSTGIV